MSSWMARLLRQNPTWAEKRLWKLLRDRRLPGYKFRRQYQKGPYYLDFFCVEAMVAVELDGFGHGHPQQQEIDDQRDSWLATQGIVVKRFWNYQLATWNGRENAIENLWLLLQERSAHPNNAAPLPERRAPDNPKAGEPSP